MSDSTFAAILTLAFFAFMVVWVPFLDSAVRVVAALKRRRTVPGANYDSAAA